FKRWAALAIRKKSFGRQHGIRVSRLGGYGKESYPSKLLCGRPQLQSYMKSHDM
ncbi:13068_t:CDS:1, partial [Funneliformis mosseae]